MLKDGGVHIFSMSGALNFLIAERHPRADEIKAAMEAGELVDSEITGDAFVRGMKELQSHESPSEVVASDGFPRTKSQAARLLAWCETNRVMPIAVDYQITLEVALERFFSAPKDRLERRDDNVLKIIGRRRLYEREILPGLLDLQSAGVPVFRMSGDEDGHFRVNSARILDTVRLVKRTIDSNHV